MLKPNGALGLDVDLQGGVVPISKAASALAALLKRSRAQRRPIIVTQKGYPTGVILDVELYTALRSLAARPAASPPAEATESAPLPDAVPAQAAEAADVAAAPPRR